MAVCSDDLPSPVCGDAPAAAVSASRIVGGAPADENEWPWVVQVGTAFKEGYTQDICVTQESVYLKIRLGL